MTGPATPLTGKVALVTGATSGIGRAVADAFVVAGARVAYAARSVDALQAAVAPWGDAALPVALDVTDEAACAAAVERTRSTLGDIDVLVHAAGIASARPFVELDLTTWRQILDVDLDGAFLVTRAVVPGMLARGSGSIVLIGSISSRIGLGQLAAYTAAKHGVLGLARALAAEYVRKGITVNCVCPAYTDTPLTESTILDIVKRTGRSLDDARQLLATPQGRLVRPEEVAAVCVLLASDAGRGITGQAIQVDGGTVQA